MKLYNKILIVILLSLIIIIILKLEFKHYPDFRYEYFNQNKEIKRLKEENEFLEEASAFFAASRLKSAKKKD